MTSDEPVGDGAERPDHSLRDSRDFDDPGATNSGSHIRAAIIGAAGAIAAAALLAAATIYSGLLQVSGKNPPASAPPTPQPVDPGQLSIKAPTGRISRCYQITITGTLPKGSVVWLASQPLGYKLHLLREIPPVPGKPGEWQLQVNIEDVENPGEYHVLQALALSQQTRNDFRSLLVQQWGTASPHPLLAISIPIYLRRDLVHNARC